MIGRKRKIRKKIEEWSKKVQMKTVYNGADIWTSFHGRENR